jgi:hypothetical protein
MNLEKRIALRASLHAEDPHCSWCGIETKLASEPLRGEQPNYRAVLGREMHDSKWAYMLVCAGCHRKRRKRWEAQHVAGAA